MSDGEAVDDRHLEHHTEGGPVMTTILCDPWVERHIAAGRLSPGARGLTREDAATQYNSANGLVPSDEDFLYSPGQAAAVVRDLLGDIGITIDEGARVLLTDMTGGPRCWSHLVEPSQVAFACEQHRLITGESIHPDALERALPWASHRPLQSLNRDRIWDLAQACGVTPADLFVAAQEGVRVARGTGEQAQ